MNKYKKIASAVVATVMAGTMVASLAACGPKNRGSNSSAITDYNTVASSKTVGGLTINLSSDGRLAYDKDTELSMNVGDGTAVDRSISFSTASGIISGKAVLPDGNTYFAGDLKPVWKATSALLGMKLKDTFTATGSDDEKIKSPLADGTMGNYSLVTGSLTQLSTSATQNPNSFVDLSKFLDYMPNYKAFLERNPLVLLSMTADTTTGAMYGAPYFDGNDDIEKYVLTKREWTRAILDKEDVSAATTTFKAMATGHNQDGAVHAQAFMGNTDWEIDATDPADVTKTVKVYVKYSAAKTALSDANSALAKAYSGAAGAAYEGTSGNIIDIMNAAITAKGGEVKGSDLIKILQAYIDVAYQKEDGTKFYTKRSDVFNSVSAAWDADLMTALYRCVATSGGLFGDSALSNYYALAAREGHMQRRSDIYSYAGELYGVRGLESRYEFTYIGADGVLRDARTSAATYEALDKLHQLTLEGLIYTGGDAANARAAGIQTFSEHDYAQTQTADGFYAQSNTGLAAKGGVISSGDYKYDFAPILTPISKWDTNDDGVKDKTMRFTESWRSVKTSGVCIPYANVANDANKLSAALNLIDFIYSNDGSVMMTFGEMSSKGNTADADGFWWATDVTASEGDQDGKVWLSEVAEPAVEGNPSSQYIVKDEYASQYFVYRNRVYVGTSYKGTQIPTITDNLRDYFYGKEVNGHKMGEASGNNEGFTKDYKTNYTNFARGVVGSCLPLVNKNQGFEYQATADCGLDGSTIVGQALANGVIKHPVQQVVDNNLWYTLVPTMLPLTQAQSGTLTQPNIAGNSSAFRLDKGTNSKNLLWQIIEVGFKTDEDIAQQATLGKIPSNAAGCVQWCTDNGMTTRLDTLKAGWSSIYSWYKAR